MSEVRRVWWDELLSRVRCFLVRLRMRMGGISVWVCPACRALSYWPAFFREPGCPCDPKFQRNTVRLGPRDWAFPRGRQMEDR